MWMRSVDVSVLDMDSVRRRALSNQETPDRSLAHEGNELVPRQAAPRGEVLLDGDFRGPDFEQPAARQRVDVLPDQEQEPVSAV
jgi:hypothetical protein